MALDEEYFDGINIDIVKKKYYNANKVNAVFQDIREQALILTEENQAMKARLEEIDGQRTDIGDAVMSAQKIYWDIVNKANEKAEEIVARANAKAAEIENSLAGQTPEQIKAREQEAAAGKMGECFDKLLRQQQDIIDSLSCQWQEFLCGLYGDEPCRSVENSGEEGIPDTDNREETISDIPPDEDNILEEKGGAKDIAQMLARLSEEIKEINMTVDEQ